MKKINSVRICGTIARSPLSGYGKSGRAYAKFTVIVDLRDYGEGINYINCVAFGEAAETIKDLSMGCVINILGHVLSSSYQQDGTKKYAQEICVDHATFDDTEDDMEEITFV